MDFDPAILYFMESYLRQAGFTIQENLERAPYENIEHPSRRGYILAQKV